MRESGRLKLIGLACLLSLLSLIPAGGIVVIGSYTRNSVQSKVRLLENFDTSELPIIMVSVGVYSVIHNLIGLSVMLSMNRHAERYSRTGILCVGTVAGIILFMIFVGLAVGCHIQIDTLDKSFHGGLLNAMKLYKKSPLVKLEIDKLQIEYRCCGSNLFTDWFTIEWVKPEFANPDDKSYRPRLGGGERRELLNDDVPFSCCKVNISRPCISHYVLNNAKHYNYDNEKSVTLNEKGCRDALVEFYGHKLMTYMGKMVAGLAFMQFLIVLCTRYIHTSTKTAIFQYGDAEEESADNLLATNDGNANYDSYNSNGYNQNAIEYEYDLNLNAQSTESFQTAIEKKVNALIKIVSESNSSSSDCPFNSSFSDADLSSDDANNNGDDDRCHDDNNEDDDDHVYNTEDDDSDTNNYVGDNDDDDSQVDDDDGYDDDDDDDDTDVDEYDNYNRSRNNAVDLNLNAITTALFTKEYSNVDGKKEDSLIKFGSVSGISSSGTSDSSPDSSFSEADLSPDKADNPWELTAPSSLTTAYAHRIRYGIGLIFKALKRTFLN